MGVCIKSLSVCPVPQHNSRMERPRKPKFDRMEVYQTSTPWTYLEVKKSKVKVTRQINAHTVNAHYIFRTGRPTKFKLGTQTQHEDPHQRQAPWPRRSKAKVAISRDASDRYWPINRERNVLGTQKLVGRLSISRAIMSTSFKVKGQRSRSPGWLMLRPEVRNIFRTGRPTNFKLGIQTEHEDPHQQQAPWSPRSKVNVSRSVSRDASDRCWAVGR